MRAYWPNYRTTGPRSSTPTWPGANVGRVAALGAGRRPRTLHTFHVFTFHVFEGYFGRAAQRASPETERMLACRTEEPRRRFPVIPPGLRP